MTLSNRLLIRLPTPHDKHTVDSDSPAITGTVELASGRWNWTVGAERGGARVLFRHEKKHRDELVCWIAGVELTAARIREAARGPLHRIWEDRDGLLWRISLEVPTLPSAARALFRDGMLLVFSRGGIRMEITVPLETAIGELTCMELAAMLGR